MYPSRERITAPFLSTPVQHRRLRLRLLPRDAGFQPSDDRAAPAAAQPDLGPAPSQHPGKFFWRNTDNRGHGCSKPERLAQYITVETKPALPIGPTDHGYRRRFGRDQAAQCRFHPEYCEVVAVDCFTVNHLNGSTFTAQ